MKISLTKLPQTLKEPTKTALGFLGHEVADDGVCLVAKPEAAGLSVQRESNHITISYDKLCQWFRGLTFLHNGTAARQVPAFDRLCYMAEASRNAVLNMDAAKELILYLAIMGYDSLMLYTEDTYEIPGEPFFGHMRGRYTQAQLRELDDYAAAFGVELIPCIQTLAHLTCMLQWRCYASLRDTWDILMADEEQTYELIDKMLASLSASVRSRTINLGMDEAVRLGLGNYLKLHGYEDCTDIMLRHVTRVAKMCEKYGYKPMMWSDMFHRLAFVGGTYFAKRVKEDVLNSVPSNMTLVHWDYYTTDEAAFAQAISEHQEFPCEIAFAGASIKYRGFAPLHTFSYGCSQMQLKVLKEKGVKQVLVTGWGDDGAEGSQFSVLPILSLFAEAQYGCEKDCADRFYACFGRTLADFMALELPNMFPEWSEKAPKSAPGKFLLYNDPLVGLMDKLVPENAGGTYAEYAEKLHGMTAGKFGYLFETLATLCDYLALRADLGVRMKTAYDANDKVQLKELAKEIRGIIIPRFDTFFAAFTRQWERENKICGFEILDHRLGGMRQRLVTAASQLERYVSGDIACIEQLAEDRLYFDCREITGKEMLPVAERWNAAMSPSYLSMPRL